MESSDDVILRSPDESVIGNPCMHIRIYFSKARNEYYYKASYGRETVNCVPRPDKLVIFCTCCRYDYVFDINTKAMDWDLTEKYNFGDSSSECSEYSCIGCERNHQDGYYGGRCEECKCGFCDNKHCKGGIDGTRCIDSDREEEKISEEHQMIDGTEQPGVQQELESAYRASGVPQQPAE